MICEGPPGPSSFAERQRKSESTITRKEVNYRSSVVLSLLDKIEMRTKMRLYLENDLGVLFPV